MAWQLIYTSAPRLLEAGRTGFGTVARHRAISGMLAATVERFSQFARLPGHDPRRVIHTYRTVMIGSSTFHVLSCLRDAGSDYSGRTNHLAHHLIAEAREIRALAGSGLTPADVLMGMAWRSSWNEPPRYMDAGEEVALGSFPAVKTHAWAALTGNADSARLLCTPAAMKGTYLICPPTVNALELFRESLLHAPQSGWQTSFTTGLEPNDEVGDFRWIGIPAASPLRGQVETSNRSVLDLTQPGQLPAPPVPAAPEPQAMVEAAPAAEPTFNTREPTPAKVTLRGALPTASAARAMETMGDWNPQPRRNAGSKKTRTTFIYSLVLVGLILMSVVGYVVWRSQSEAQAKEAFEQQVNQTWDKWVTAGALPQTKAIIAEQKDLEQGRLLLESYQSYFKQLHAALSKSGTLPDVGLPGETVDEIADLQKAFGDWQEIDTRLRRDWQVLTDPAKPMQLGLLLQKYEDWQKRRKAAWAVLTSYLRGIAEPQAAPGFRQGLLQPIKKHVSARPWDSHEHATLEILNKRLGPDGDLTRWMKLMAGLEGNDKALTAETIMQDDKVPKWLRDKAQKTQERQVKDTPKSDPMADAKAKAEAEKTRKEAAAAKKEDADALEARNPIFICLPKAGESIGSLLEKETFKREPGMHLFVGAAWDREPLPQWLGDEDNGEAQFRLNFNAPLSSIFEFSNEGKIVHLPENAASVPEGYRLIGRSSDDMKVLFDFRLIPAAQKNKPVLTNTLRVSVTNAAEVTVAKLGALLERLHFIGVAEPQFLIRLEGSSTEQKLYGLKTTPGDSRVTVMNAQPAASSAMAGIGSKELDARIKELEDGIAKDNQDIAKNEKSKSSERIRKENHDKYTAAKSKKEIELEQVKAKKQSLESQANQPFNLSFVLVSGEYTLLEKTSGNTMICKLLITAEDKAANSKTAQP